jgi:transcriptional regulator with XRE-family HTH domain
MGHFWGSETLGKESQVDYGSFMVLRHRVIGVLLRQLRLQARRSVREFAELLNVPEAQIDAYEAGEAVIPYVHLEQLSRHLEVPINYFLDNHRGPLGRHEAEQKLQKLFHQLSPDMQAFIVNPSNRSYLETAKRLSEMDVQRLRQVAESILDITF